MTQAEQTKAAKEFAEYWQDKGDEKQHTQQFWINLLRNVLGVENAETFIEFEKRVKLSHASFIDAYIPATKVLIEQKDAKIDLHKGYGQSDGSILTPYQQAKRYADEMPNSIRPDWIVVSNFTEFLIYNMETPHAEPVQILLKDLEKEYYRLSFIADTGSIHLKQEMEVSVEAGRIVGKIYDALLKQYKNPESEKTLKSLNMLCVRLVFCLYAEDAGIFNSKSQFHDYMESFRTENMRQALLSLFKVLDTKTEDRDEELEEKLAAFPYVNGGLFTEEDASPASSCASRLERHISAKPVQFPVLLLVPGQGDVQRLPFAHSVQIDVEIEFSPLLADFHAHIDLQQQANKLPTKIYDRL